MLLVVWFFRVMPFSANHKFVTLKFYLAFADEDKESEESDQGKLLMLLVVTNCMLFPCAILNHC